MTAAWNKRQQARNERALQDLIRNVPGNDVCADCGARNPGWASWSLGVFLCLRCAALHRKLGTHLSKVKSLSMDSWNNEQVEHMKRVGNIASNRLFNPSNVKPSIPIDIDEVEGAMERFIRQKYEQRVFSSESRPGTRQNTGSTSSDDRGPPLPPKPTKRFGFGLRATSSTFPASRSDRPSPPVSPAAGSGSGSNSPTGPNKASRVFGSNLGGSDASFDSKLSVLRDMGFQDEKRNATVLRGLNGNVDKAVETLIRLGEQNRDTSRSRTPVAQSNLSGTTGITIERDLPKPPSGDSSNPFDMLDRVQTSHPAQVSATQQAQSAFPQSAGASYNPFLNSVQPQPAQSGQGLEQSFQNLNISQQPAHRLFPNSTGGYGNQPQNQHNNPYLQTYTPPPVPQIPPQYNAPPTQQSAFPHAQNHQSPQPTGGNPFLRASRSQVFAPSNPFDAASMGDAAPAYQAQQSNTHSSSFAQLQPHGQYQQASPQQPQPTGFVPSYSNPYFQQTQQPSVQSWQQPEQPQQASNSSPWDSQQQYQQQQQPHWAPQPLSAQVPQQPFQRRDKSSILALYAQSSPMSTNAAATMPTSSQVSNPTDQIFSPPQRSATMPISTAPNTEAAGGSGQPATSMNPFASASTDGTGITANQPQRGMGNPTVGNGLGGPSRESVDFAGLMGGRTSPDAFAGLSARYVR